METDEPKKHKPAPETEAADETNLKPIPRRRERKIGPSMGEIARKVVEAKYREQAEEAERQRLIEQYQQRQSPPTQQQQPEQSQSQQQQQQQQKDPEQPSPSTSSPSLKRGNSSDSGQTGSSHGSQPSRNDTRHTTPEQDTPRQGQEIRTPETARSRKTGQRNRTPDPKQQRRNRTKSPGKKKAGFDSPRVKGQKADFSPYGSPLPSIDSPRSDKEGVASPRNTSKQRRDAINNRANEQYVSNQWQDASLVECNRHMMTKEVDCDVTFIVGEDEEAVMAHSYVLMSRSSRMQQLLKKDASKKNKLYTIPGVPSAAFRDMIKYMYTDEVEIKGENATALLPLANNFGMTSLRNRCLRVVMSDMGSHNAATILEKAHKYDEFDIYDKCMRFILFTGKDVMKAHSLKDLCRECLEKIVSSDDLNADESSVFNGLLHWARFACMRDKIQASDTNKREVLGDLTFCVRYSQLSVRDFTEHVSKRDVLTSEEKILLYQFFHGDISNLPDKFQHNNPRNLRGTGSDSGDSTQSSSLDLDLYSTWNGAGSSVSISPSDGSIPRTIHHVNRFNEDKGSWKVNNPDAISFKASDAFVLRGFQVYGPIRKACCYTIDYTVQDDLKNKIREDTVTATIEKDDTYDVLLSEPLLVPEGRLFTVEMKMVGKEATMCGVNGTKSVKERGIEFEFLDSCRSLNGTDVTTGQLPTILFSAF